MIIEKDVEGVAADCFEALCLYLLAETD